MSKSSKSSVAPRTVNETIDTLVKHRDHLKTVAPGLAQTFDARIPCGNGICQGDLILVMGRVVPKAFAEIKPLKDPKFPYRLVNDKSDGGNHHLHAPTSGSVTILEPESWTEESLDGPVLILEPNTEVDVIHTGSGKHGPVHLSSGSSRMIVKVQYPRVWAIEARKERRARD